VTDPHSAEPTGARIAAGLLGVSLPNVRLPATPDGRIGLAELGAELLVLYLCPYADRNQALRDSAAAFAALGARLAGLSAQSYREQLEAAERLGLSFPLLADPLLRVARALPLPTFEDARTRLYRDMILICHSAVIVHVLYPALDAAHSADQALAWLRDASCLTSTAAR
jgi:peroxiredoxin